MNRFPMCCLLAVSLITGSCEGGGRSKAGVVVRDSAGVAIVENAAPLWSDGASWRVSQPVVDIGVLEGAPQYQLFRAASAVLLDDGTIVVANAGTHELRFYDREGRHVRSTGRRGGGPGEFQSLGYVARHGRDSLLAFDLRQRRTSVYAVSGDFVRAVSLERGGFAEFVGVLGDGSVVLAGRSFGSGEAGEGVYRGSVAFVRYLPDGALGDTVGVFPGAEWFQYPSGPAVITGGLLFGRDTYGAAVGDRIYIGSSDSHEIGVYSPDGRLTRMVRWARTARPVTDSDFERAKQYVLSRAESDNERLRTEEMLAAMPRVRSLPAFEAFLIDRSGNLWVEDYQAPGAQDESWTVFDREGQWLGTVSMPPRFRALDIAEHDLLGRWWDEFDVEHVQLRRLLERDE